MKTLEISLGDRSYPIYIGSGLLSKADLLIPHIHGKQVFIISNEIVAPLYLSQLVETLGDTYDVASFILPDGEQTKSLSQVESVFSGMLKVPCDRTATIITLGGGVVGDLAGFCAASYQRALTLSKSQPRYYRKSIHQLAGKQALIIRLVKI